ncbi:YadA-like family protein (plasmid) [Salmonella enterica]|nr:YadA-like family protein [Salmonella enterica]
MNNMKITPIALMLINAIGLSSVHADTSVVNCNTTDHDSDLFCGNNINTNGAVNSVAIGNSVLIPKISVPGKTGIEQAVAIGSNVQATGDNSLVIGNEAITGKSGSIAIGGDDAAGTYNANGKGYILRAFGSNFFDNNITDYRANAAIGNGAVSLGSNSQALADGAVSIGAAATAGAGTQRGNEWDSSSGKQSIALGAESSALNDNTIALGYRTTSTGNSSTAIGNSTVATANNALALGSHSHADADGAVIIGSDAKNTRDTLTAVGLPADNGVNAIGIGSSVRSAANGIAIGRGAEAKISEATTIAIGNGAVSAGGIALGQDSAVVKGNNPSGTASASVSIGRQTTVADYGVALGSRASVGMTLTADGIPERLTSGGLYGTAVGINSGVYSNSALAVGHNAKVSENADAALAVGYNSLSSAQNAIAIGNTTKASAENAISIGTGNTVSGDNSGAIGDPSTVSGMNSYSLGNNNTVSANNAFVLGNSVNNAVDSSVVLGDGSTVMAAVATPEYTVNGTTHKFAGSLPVSTVSIGDSGKERTLTNVAAGRVSAASTDAINGSQLFAVASEVEKGNQFAGNTGAFNRRLGEITTISGGLVADATASSKNIRTVAKDGQIDIQMADNLDVASVKAGTTLLNDDGLHITGGPSVTSGGINGGNKIISNVSDGVTDTDAVNKRQLDNMAATASRGWNIQANGGDTETVAPGDTVNVAGGDNIEVTRTGRTLNIATGRRVSFDNVTIGGLTLDKDTGKISGLSDGTLSADSKDAVNGGQLFGTNVNVTANTRSIAANKALLDSGLNFVGNTGAFNRRLGEITTISGGLVADATASNKNIRTVAKDGQIDIQMADNLDVASVKAGTTLLNDDGLHITGGPSVTSGGINGGNKIISNVSDGVTDTDAVNKRQLDNMAATASRGWNIQANGGDTETVAPGDTVNVAGGDNIEVTRTGRTLNIATGRRVSFDNVTIGGLTLDKDTGKISGLSDGTLSADSKDAVNGGQLFGTNVNVTANTRSIAANKALLDSGLNFVGNTGAFNRRLGEITTISGGLVADATASNKNIRTVAKDGQIDIQMADNLDVASVKAGTTLLNDDGLHITGGPSVTSGGINGGNKIISNVSDGVTDTDAVNKRQLDNISSVVGQGLTFAANEGSDITRKPGDTLVLKGDASTKGDYSGKNIKTVTDISSGMISIQIAESPMFGSVVINNNNSGKITGVNDGAISAESKDAVNGGQIHRVTTSISNIIGGNTHSGADGSLVTSNIGNTGKNTIHDAIDSVRSTAETASSGWNLSVNGQQSSAVKPRETVDLNNKDGNISIAKKDNQVSFNLSDSVKVKESIGIENGPSLTRNGIDGAGMKITNVADGVIAAGSKDVVNGGQIHDFVSGEIARPITFSADSGTPYDARMGTVVNVKGDNKNIHTTVSGNTLSVSLNESINVKSVTATESLSVANGASVDMGGNAIHNVGNATRPGDAVNYGQFQQAFSNLGNQINRVERRANAGAAAAIATAGLTQAYIPGKSMMSMSGGTFQGESSLAIGMSTISDNGSWVLKGSFSSTTRNQTGASVGVGFQF